MLNFITNLFNGFNRSKLPTNYDNAKSSSETNVSTNNTIQVVELEQEIQVQKSVEELVFEMLKETINSIELDLKSTNTDSSDLLTMCYSVLRSEHFDQLKQPDKLEMIDKKLYRRFKSSVVCGELNGKNHTWIVVGLDENYFVTCNFIYKKYEKKEKSKWIIDLQPILDDVNNHIAILDYNEHPEYVPYGNKTIENVEVYLQSKSKLKNVIIYQQPEYYTHMSGNITKIHNGYYFDADILLFLLDSDFVSCPHRYVNNTNKELFEKIQKHTNQLMELIESEDCLDVKRYIIDLFQENEKLDLDSSLKHYQVMF